MKKMAKMVNPNTVTDMALVNARAQMKTQQLLQKVGKGKRKVSNWRIWFNFLIILKRKQK